MVVAIAMLAGTGLVLVSGSSVLLLRSYLVARVDRQLAEAMRPFEFDIANGAQRFTAPNPGHGFGWKGAPQFGPPNELRIYANDGTLVNGLATSASRPDFGPFTTLAAKVGAGPFTVDVDGTAWRVMVVHIDHNPFEPAARDFDGYAVASVSLAEIDDTQLTLLVLSLATTAVVLIGIAIAAASVVRVGLRPLTQMEQAATEIAGGDLSRRVADADPHTESGRLGAALNTMLLRIETAMWAKTESEARLRQFLADAAHELRTPLTSIQGFAELYRKGWVRSGPDLEEAMSAIAAEVGRMRLLVDDLMLLARLGEKRDLACQSVDLLEVAADTVRDAHIRVPGRFVLLEPLDNGNDTFDSTTVVGDESRLRQVATNLVANALQHTPVDTEVVVRVGLQTSGSCSTDPPVVALGHDLHEDHPVGVLEVADAGPGMRPADASRVFERLYRVDPSRSRQHGGAGLGLSIVSAIVQAHGGRVELWTAPGAGSRFRVLLPVD